MNEHRLTKPGPQNAALRDYDSVRRAIAFISEHWRAQPTIEAMAEAASVTPDELHHLFRRWAGLTPKAFMQALTLDHAKGLLRDSASVLDAALDSGLSGPGRLHDLFVTHEAMSPGEWKAGGEGLTISYGFHPSPFGLALVFDELPNLCILARIGDLLVGGEELLESAIAAYHHVADDEQGPAISQHFDGSV